MFSVAVRQHQALFSVGQCSVPVDSASPPGEEGAALLSRCQASPEQAWSETEEPLSLLFLNTVLSLGGARGWGAGGMASLAAQQ